MEERVRAALHMVRLTTDAGEHFTCVLTAGRGIDFFDDEWAAIGRGQAFAILAIQPVSISETVEDDTWITALADYTTAVLGTGWHIYKNAWPQDYTAPAILWHITTVGPITQVTSGLFRVVKHIQGHYVGRTPNEQLAAMVTMVERFGRDIKITLDATNRRFLTVAAPTIDQRVDALRAGQMAIQLSRLTQRPTEDVPKMRIVHVGGKLN
jgi:hypothetical protein